MREIPHIAVVFNEPVITSGTEKKLLSEFGSMENINSRGDLLGKIGNLIDISEVGVIEEREQVEKALRKKGYRTSLFNVDGNIKKLIEFLEEQKPTLVFNLCESIKGRSIHEMHVAGLYELLDVNFTGASSLSLGTCLNKARTKELLRAYGITTPRYKLFNSELEIKINELDLNFPLIVKPAQEDASVGIENNSVVNNLSMLCDRVKHITKTLNQPALVEEYIEGRELNVAIIGNDNLEVLPISEIDFSKLPENYPKIVTYNAKWVEGTPEYSGTVGVCPAKLDLEVEKKVREIATRAYRIMEIRDYARVDIRLNSSNVPYVLEVNPNPDISRDAGFTRSAKAAGMSYEDMIAKIVEVALERSRIK